LISGKDKSESNNPTPSRFYNKKEVNNLQLSFNPSSAKMEKSTSQK